MRSIKWLSGPERGKEYLLPEGLIVFGRGSDCQIVVLSDGVSKKHAQITVDSKGRLRISDLKSSNGVFLNGKRIREARLKEGDRVALYNAVFEVQKKTAGAVSRHQYGAFSPPLAGGGAPSGAVPLAEGAPAAEGEEIGRKAEKAYQSFQSFKDSYLHQTVLPGIYKLAEVTDFKTVVALFILVFGLALVALSAVPMNLILKSSLETESKNHAESIAKTLAQANRKSLKEGFTAGLNVDFARRRPGVKKALIINAVNGRVMAPAESAHIFPREPFIHRARKTDQISVERTGASTVAAAAPIKFYNPQTGGHEPSAFSIVFYDMGALSKAGKKAVLSLVFQNFFIAAVLGFLLYFFLVHLIHFPVRDITLQLNQALKGDSGPGSSGAVSSVSTKYQSEEFQYLCESLNSALNQLAQSKAEAAKTEKSGASSSGGRQNEMANLPEVIGYPALSLDLADNTFAGLNSGFQEQFGMEEILHQPLDGIDDGDFRDGVQEILEKGLENPEDISFGEMQIKDVNWQTACQFVKGGDQQPAFAVITFVAPPDS